MSNAEPKTSPWTCPECHRPFKHKNQAHSCVSVAADVILENTTPNVQKIFRKLQREAMKFGNVKISPTKSTIMLVSRSTFVAVKPKRNWIDIEFLLDREIAVCPIHKAVRANKSRVAHFVRLESPTDVNARLLKWLRESYTLTASA